MPSRLQLRLIEPQPILEFPGLQDEFFVCTVSAPHGCRGIRRQARGQMHEDEHVVSAWVVAVEQKSWRLAQENMGNVG